MKKTNMFLKLSLLLILSLMMAACGSSKSPTSDYSNSSRVTDDLKTPSDTTNVTRALAYCNQASNNQLKVSLSTFQDGETTALNRINLKITQIPAYFAQNQNYVEFHKWKMNTSGSKIWGDTRMYFHIYSIATGERLVDNKLFLYWTDLQSAAQKVGATTPDQFFKKVRFVIELEDYSGDYDVITTRYHNQSDDSILSELDALIPVFDANPTLYAKEKDGSARNQKLRDLHPFKSYASQGWTVQDYQDKANEFCKPVYTVQ